MKAKNILMTLLLMTGAIAAKAVTGYPAELALVSQPVMVYNNNSITVYYDVENIGDYTYKGNVYLYLNPDDGYCYAQKYVKVAAGKIKRVSIDIPASRIKNGWVFTIMPYYELNDELYSFTTFEYFEPVSFCWDGPRNERWVVVTVPVCPTYYHRPCDIRFYYDCYHGPSHHHHGHFDGAPHHPHHPASPAHHTYSYHHDHATPHHNNHFAPNGGHNVAPAPNGGHNAAPAPNGNNVAPAPNSNATVRPNGHASNHTGSMSSGSHNVNPTPNNPPAPNGGSNVSRPSSGSRPSSASNVSRPSSSNSRPSSASNVSRPSSSNSRPSSAGNVSRPSSSNSRPSSASNVSRPSSSNSRPSSASRPSSGSRSSSASSSSHASRPSSSGGNHYRASSGRK